MGYWKRSAALGIDFAHKYRFDPFVRTEVNVVALHITLAAFLLGVVAIIASQLYHDAADAVLQGIQSSLTTGSTPASVGDTVIAQLTSMRSRTVWVAAGSIILITGVFTYIIARLALSPTRSALESQKQFIGNIAHELRTPLSVGKTNIEVALMSPSIEPGLKDSLESTVEEFDRMGEIINNLLSLSAFTRREQVEFHDVDLGAVVHTVLRMLRGLAESKRIEMEVRLSDRTAVWGNHTALEQIVMNIIKNAIIYTPHGGRMRVVVEPVYPDFIEFRVRDSGTGIARKDLFRIFEPYYRADPSRTREQGGSGLGLTIVSELVKLHNGKITVRSAEGRGTSVTVLLPAGKIGLGAEKAAERDTDWASEVAVDFSHNGRRSL